MDLLDRSDLDTYLARLLLREGRLTREALQALLGAARASRGQGGPTLARTLVERKLIARDELGAILARGVEETRGGPVGPGPTPSRRRLGDYELLEELGAGGMGRVFRARHVETGALYALKTLSAADPDALLRFQREGLGQARVDAHSGIVQVHALDRDAGIHFLVMDLVTGGTLEERIAGGLPDPEVAAGWVRELALAIEHAHAHGVLHRDLKPANVLFAGDRPMLVDFGLAKLADLRSMTETGSVMGTPSYMAPEQVETQRGRADARTDVYGLGGLLYFGFTGVPPFRSGTLWATLAQVLEERPRAPGELRPGLSPALAQVCLRCLEKDPRRRYPSAAALAEAIEAALEPQPARTPWVAGVAVAGVVLAGMVVLAASIRPEVSPSPSPTPASQRTPTPTPTPTPATTTTTTTKNVPLPPRKDRRKDSPGPQASDRDMILRMATVGRTTEAVRRLQVLIEAGPELKYSGRYMRELGVILGRTDTLENARRSRAAMVKGVTMGDGESALILANYHLPKRHRQPIYPITAWDSRPDFHREDKGLVRVCLSLARHYVVKGQSLSIVERLIERFVADPPDPQTALNTFHAELGGEALELEPLPTPTRVDPMWTAQAPESFLATLEEHWNRHSDKPDLLQKLMKELPNVRHREVYRKMAGFMMPGSHDQNAYLARAALIGDARAAMILARAAGVAFNAPPEVTAWSITLPAAQRTERIGRALLRLAAHYGGRDVRARVMQSILTAGAPLKGARAEAYGIVWKAFPEGR